MDEMEKILKQEFVADSYGQGINMTNFTRFGPNDSISWAMIEESDFMRILENILQVFFGAVFIAGLGNVYLAIAMIRGQLITDAVTRIIVFNLTVSNGTLIFSIPLLIASMITKKWSLGPVVCKLYWTVEQGNKYSSIIFLTYLCCDWFIAVVLVNRSMTLRRIPRCLVTVGLCWITIIVALLPVIMYADLRGARCSLYWPDDENKIHVEKTYFILTLVFLFFIPSAVIGVVNSCVVARLNRVSKRVSLRTVSPPMNNQLLCPPDGTIANSPCSNANSHVSECSPCLTQNDTNVDADASSNRCPNRRQNRLRIGRLVLHGARKYATGPGQQKYRRISIIIILVSICHVALWAPFWITSLALMTRDVIPTDSLILWMQVINILPYVNCAAFPYFYLLVKGERGRTLSLRPLIAGTAV